MKETENEILNKRGRIVKQCQDLKERMKSADFTYTQELKDQFKGWHDELLAIDSKLEDIKKMDEIDGIRGEQTDKLKEVIKPRESVEGKREFAKKSLIKWIRKGPLHMSEEEKQVAGINSDDSLNLWPFKAGLYDGEGRDANDPVGKQAIQRAQSTTTTAGGYTIAEDFSREIETRLKWYGPFANREVCRVWASDNGATMPYPTVDDVSNTGALLTEAGDASDTVTDVTFDEVSFAAYKYTSKLIKVNKELEQDSYFDIIGYITDALATRLGRALNTAFTTGTGSSQPQGAVTGASLYNWCASSTTFTRAELQALVMKGIDKAYMDKPLTRLMFHSDRLYDIRVLDDSSANYSQAMWQPSFALGVPPTILGVPYAINNDMAQTMDGTDKIFLYGDFSKFVCRWILPMRVVTLRERYAETDQTGIVAFQRVDSHVIQSNAIKYIETT